MTSVGGERAHAHAALRAKLGWQSGAVPFPVPGMREVMASAEGVALPGRSGCAGCAWEDLVASMNPHRALRAARSCRVLLERCQVAQLPLGPAPEALARTHSLAAACVGEVVDAGAVGVEYSTGAAAAAAPPPPLCIRALLAGLLERAGAALPAAQGAADSETGLDARAFLGELAAPGRGGGRAEDLSMRNFDPDQPDNHLRVVRSLFPGRMGTVLFVPADFVSVLHDKRLVERIPTLTAPDDTVLAGAYGAAPHVWAAVPKRPKKGGPARPGSVFANIGEGVVRFGVLMATLQRAGLRLTTDPRNAALFWARRVKPTDYGAARGALMTTRRVNHFPGAWGVGRKDLLARNMMKMRQAHGEAYGFHPETYVLPGDADKLARAFRGEGQRRRSSAPPPVFISKPSAQACGRGIHLLTAMPAAADVKPSVVQRYLSAPLLVDGYKVDFRLYVVVTSVAPLRIYLYDEGMVRFATEKYPGAGHVAPENQYAHLTNYSINKHNERYAAAAVEGGERRAAGDAEGGGGHEEEEGAEGGDEEEEGGGSKWTLTQFRQYCAQQGIDFAALHAQFRDVVVKTMLSIEEPVHSGHKTTVKERDRCFQIFGVDVMVDASLTAHLLEVNVMPSLNSMISPLDAKIKCNLVADLLTLIGVRAPSAPGGADGGDAARPATSIKERLEREATARRGRSGSDPAGIDAAAAAAPTAPRPRRRSSSGAAGSAVSGEAGLLPGFNQYWRRLAPEQRAAIAESEEEYQRRGHFARVYPPPPDAPAQYDQYFAAPREANALLQQWEAVKLAAWQEVLAGTGHAP